ncbi:peptidase inhibitor family I36 protein [Kitasatospora sp. NPDC004615]|uniref:peptidase inhibitor family I36 protein n=1 Tax=Kitasatospora sp. NPDC004615 TaxID=3364017 RepID=UPI0036C63075
MPGLTAPAHAAEEDCPKDKFCFWSEPDYSGTFRAADPKPGGCAKGGKVTWPDETRSRVESLYDNTRFLFETYGNEDCSGAPVAIHPPGFSAASIGSDVKSFRVSPVCEKGGCASTRARTSPVTSYRTPTGISDSAPAAASPRGASTT